MKVTPINPSDGIYPATGDYLHALEVREVKRMLYISGTMGLDQTGKAPKGLDAQLALIWQNITRILKEARMTTDNVARVTSYLTDAAFAQTNQDARVRALGAHRVPTTAIVVQTLDPTWLVELEVIAVA